MVQINREQNSHADDHPFDDTISDTGSGSESTGQDGQAESVDYRQYKDELGHFVKGWPGGPGRGKVGAGPQGNGGQGEGELSTADLMTLLDNAIRRRGDKFWDELVKDRPVVAAQLRQVLIKAGDLEAVNREVVVHLGDGLAGIAASIMTRPALGPAADLDLATARKEVQRLRDENESLQRTASGLPPVKPKDEPPPPEPSKEAVECPDCLMRVNIGGRMIEPYSKCKFCGQSYADTMAKVLTANRPAPPDPDARLPCADAMCVRLDGGEDGWKPVKSLSVAGIHEALAGGDRSPFD